MDGQHEHVPRPVEALASKKAQLKVVGVSIGAAWTEAGELFTFGQGHCGKLGHRGEENQFVPRLVGTVSFRRLFKFFDYPPSCGQL
jgi:alpha-tubulin suppressor-like RCC1 family protein